MFIKIANLILNTFQIIEIDLDSKIKLQPYTFDQQDKLKALEDVPVVRIVTTQNEWQFGGAFNGVGEGQHTIHLFYGETAEKLRQRLPVALRKTMSNFENLEIEELFIPECFKDKDAPTEEPPGYPD